LILNGILNNFFFLPGICSRRRFENIAGEFGAIG
jgi:hypothetical protein